MIIAIIFALALTLTIGIVLYTSRNKISKMEPVATEVVSKVSPKIDSVLGIKLEILKGLAKDELVVSESKRVSGQNKNLTMTQITDLDTKWSNEPKGSDYINGFLTNLTALRLIKFQETNPGFVEVFLTDMNGLNVGQTNKTSDFYQADEEWWLKAYADGLGKSYYGELEYDESAGSQSVSLYAPVYDGREVVGVIKAVLDISAIENEL